MANEATVQCSLQVKSGSLEYQSRPTAFRADVSSAKGPTPGVLAVSTTGVDVSFSQLTTPGLCRLMNLESAGGNYVEFGVHDGAIFHALGEMLPGETFVIRLSRNLGEEASVPGTGTTGVVNSLYLRANTASVNVLVEAFET